MTPAAAFAVSTMPLPETAAGALEASVRSGSAAVGRMEVTGTLGSTVAAVGGELAAPGSLQAAGVLSPEVDGQGWAPAGVEAVPGVSCAVPLLVKHDAPAPEAGHG